MVLCSSVNAQPGRVKLRTWLATSLKLRLWCGFRYCLSMASLSFFAISAVVGVAFLYAAALDTMVLWHHQAQRKLLAWKQLGVPAPLARPLVVGIQIGVHVLLTVLLFATNGTLHWFVALVVTLLCGAYALVVWHAWRNQRSCGCFHEDAPATIRDIARAVALLLAAAAATGGSWKGWTARAALTQYPLPTLGILAAVLLTVVVAVSLAPERPAAYAPAPVDAANPPVEEPATQEDGAAELEYERTPIPQVHVLRGEEEISLQHLVNAGPTLLFYLSGACWSCREICALLPDFQARLPQLRFAALSSDMTDAPQVPEGVEQFWDRNRVVWWLLGMMTPSVVLLTPDGMISGGPVLGAEAVKTFIDEVEAELRAVQQDMQLPG